MGKKFKVRAPFSLRNLIFYTFCLTTAVAYWLLTIWVLSNPLATLIWLSGFDVPYWSSTIELFISSVLEGNVSRLVVEMTALMHMARCFYLALSVTVIVLFVLCPVLLSHDRFGFATPLRGFEYIIVSFLAFAALWQPETYILEIPWENGEVRPYGLMLFSTLTLASALIHVLIISPTNEATNSNKLHLLE